MTINKIIEAIAEALFNEFGYDYSYYKENIKQGFDVPCFYIKPIEPYVDEGLNRDNKHINKFDIQFISQDSESSNKELYDIYEALVQALEYIKVDRKTYKGIKMQSHIESGVLHFFINYNFHILKPKDKNFMEALEQKGGLKNG